MAFVMSEEVADNDSLNAMLQSVQKYDDRSSKTKTGVFHVI